MGLNGWRNLLRLARIMASPISSLLLLGPKCNDMVERLIKTLKQGLIIMAPININSWDLLLPWILFGYCCGIQANTKYSSFMVLIRCTPRLTIDNNFNGFCDVFDEFASLKVMVEQMVQKM